MKEKINIAEFLKDCPGGMELDCTMYEDCKFLNVGVDPGNSYLIRITTPCGIRYLDKYGRYTNDDKAKCVIFPKGKTTWEGFVPPCKFKDGDVIVDKQGNIAIYKQVHKSYEESCVDFHCRIYEGDKNLFHTNFVKGSLEHCGAIDSARFATEEEKQKLFDAIKENGYKWNETTKTLEKLVKPKFKAGDKVVKKDGITIPVLITKVGEEFYSANTENSIGFFSIKDQDDWELATPVEPKFKVGDTIKNKKFYKRGTITKIHQDCYEYDNRYILTFENQDNWELVELKFKVGDRIRRKGICKNGLITGIELEYFYKVEYDEGEVSYVNVAYTDDWELVPNKFDINTLIPFESRVLMRSSNAREWTGTIFSHYSNNKFYGCGMCCDQCIPYEGNEHLIGKTDDCNNYYKIWEMDN